MSIDDFIAAKVLPEIRSVLEKIGEVMRECAHDAQEIIIFGIPA